MTFGRTKHIMTIGAAALIVCSLCPAIAEEEDTSRSVRIIDGQTAPIAPPPAAKPPAVSPEPDASKNTESSPAPAAQGTLTPTRPAPPVANVSPRLDSLSNPSDAAVPVVVSNPAELTLEMLPAASIAVGSRVSFRISAKKPGYLILLDVDPTGKLTQIYPSPVSVTTGRGTPNANFVKPGKPIQIPSPVEPYMGFEFVASPPVGSAMVVALLSDQPVQLIDLPDMPPSLVGQNSAVGFLSKLASELRIPSARDDDSRLRKPTWSLSAKFYQIKQASD
jgi:hypothetical protein